MRQFMAWGLANAENLLALLLAAGMGVLGILDQVSVEFLVKAIPLSLAVIAFVLLRDRWREGTANAEVHTATLRVADALQQLDERVERLATMDRTLKSTQQALNGLLAVRVATGDEVTELLARARADTDRWIFRGGTGTHTRVVTLPECVRKASHERRELLVRMEILDPTDAELCRRYAELYQSLAESKDDLASRWTGKDTQIDSYATVLAGCWYKQRFEHWLNIEIALSSSLSTFRWDLSSRYLVITQRGPRFPAMIVERGQPYYDSWNIELRMHFRECQKVNLDRVAEVRLSRNPSVAAVRELLHRVEVPLPEDYSDDDVRTIASKALNDTSRFIRGAGDNLTVDGRPSSSGR
jgi:hypothetical protein